jgi:hypothetical protein
MIPPVTGSWPLLAIVSTGRNRFFRVPFPPWQLNVLSGGEDNPSERDHAFLADRLTNNSERLLANIAVGSEVNTGYLDKARRFLS